MELVSIIIYSLLIFIIIISIYIISSFIIYKYKSKPIAIEIKEPTEIKRQKTLMEYYSNSSNVPFYKVSLFFKNISKHTH